MSEASVCANTRMMFALLLYGELSFDEEERVDAHLEACAECRAALEREKSLHAGFDGVAIEPAASLLRQCRMDLAATLDREQPPERTRGELRRTGWWEGFAHLLRGPILRPVAALALVALGFFGARLTPFLSENLLTASSQPGIRRVSDVEAQNDGSVRIVVDETRQKTISGNMDEQPIRNLLLDAVRDTSNPGLREVSASLLSQRAQSAEIRTALVGLVGYDKDDGVRLRAMKGLQAYVADPEVRGALRRALLSDANPGVRTQAIDLLIPGPDNGSVPNIDLAMIGTLQELMLRENNASLRQRCERVLEAINASAEIY